MPVAAERDEQVRTEGVTRPLPCVRVRFGWLGFDS